MTDGSDGMIYDIIYESTSIMISHCDHFCNSEIFQESVGNRLIHSGEQSL